MAKTGKKEKKRNHAGSIFSLILLTGAAGAIFYFGWVQFDLPENSYAVLFSKTGGYDKNVIKPGQFSWKWERLLPTNSKLIKVEIEQRSIDLIYQGELPSADLYSSIIPENPDFSYKMDFSVSYRIKEDSLPELIESDELNADNLKMFYDTFETEYIKIIKDRCTDFFNLNYIIDSQGYLELEKNILNMFKESYPFIETKTLTIKYIHFPDLKLYDKSRDLYFQILENRQQVETATEKWAIESKVNMDTKLEILREYGEILSKYPVLIDYFALDPESQVLDISNLKDYKYETGDE